jgi:hypothetical protein
MPHLLGEQLTDLRFIEAYRAQGRDPKHRDLLAQQARQYLALRDEFGQEPTPYPQAVPDLLDVCEAEVECRREDRVLRLMGARRQRGA